MAAVVKALRDLADAIENLDAEPPAEDESPDVDDVSQYLPGSA